MRSIGIATLVLWGALALAAPAAAERARPEAQARALYQQAQQLERDGRLTEALQRLREAYAVVPTPTLLFPMARLCERLKQPRAGLEATDRLRRQVPAAQREPGQGAAELAQLEERLRAQLGRLRVRTDLAGALILIDGREVGRSPLDGPVVVDPGPHEVEVRGAREARLPQVEVGPGEEREAVVTTAPEPAPPALRAVAPTLLPARPPASRPPAAPPPRRYRPGAPTWVAVGLTGAALAAAGGVGLGAYLLRAQLAPRCTGALCYGSGDDSLAALNDDVARVNALTRATPILLGVAGGLAAATVVVGVVEWRLRGRGRR